MANARPTGLRVIRCGGESGEVAVNACLPRNEEDAAEKRYVEAGGGAGFLLAGTSDCNGSVPSAFSSVVGTKLGICIRCHMCGRRDALESIGV